MDPIFSSNSIALQVGLHKRFAAGFQLNAEYEWINVLGTENFVNPMNTNDSFGNISGIAPQTLNVSYSYVLPFGQSRRFLANAGGLVVCDQDADEFEPLRRGEIDAIIAQDVFTIGNRAAEAIVQRRRSGTRLASFVVDPILLTRENVLDPAVQHRLRPYSGYDR